MMVEKATHGKSNSIEGVITDGSFQGKKFVFFLGESPQVSQLLINNVIIPFTNAQISIDREERAIKVHFNCWILPDE
jgi:hypothetical protein